MNPERIVVIVVFKFYMELIRRYERLTLQSRNQPGNWKYFWSEQRNKACSELGYFLQKHGLRMPVRNWPKP